MKERDNGEINPDELTEISGLGPGNEPYSMLTDKSGEPVAFKIGQGRMQRQAFRMPIGGAVLIGTHASSKSANEKLGEEIVECFLEPSQVGRSSFTSIRRSYGPTRKFGSGWDAFERRRTDTGNKLLK